MIIRTMAITWTQNAWDFQTFVKSIATTMEEGKALWAIIQNKHIFLNGNQVPTGSLRWNAHIIASVTGGDYMDYYCAEEMAERNGFSTVVKNRIQEKLQRLGYILKEIDLD